MSGDEFLLPCYLALGRLVESVVYYQPHVAFPQSIDLRAGGRTLSHGAHFSKLRSLKDTGILEGLIQPWNIDLLMQGSGEIFCCDNFGSAVLNKMS